MKIGVIGGGVVGKAVARTYLEFVDEVRVWDIRGEAATAPRDTTLNSDIVFLCLPESEVEPFFRDMSIGWKDIGFVLKSTVPIGTTRRLSEKYGLKNLVHSPEFLTARCSETDARVPAVNVIGVPKPCNLPAYPALFTGDNNGAQELNILYRRRFPGIQNLLMSSDESEAIKLMLNAAFSVKVALFNEFRSLCDKLGLRWNVVRAGLLADGRLTAHHTQVPGPDGKFGFGGGCLPKDLITLLNCYLDADISAPVMWTAKERNKTDRNKEV